MENEPTTAVINGDATDTHSQVNEAADNASFHSSRAGSARSGRSKAASVREATAIDDNTDGRKPSPIAVTSPKLDGINNVERQPSAQVKPKPPSPTPPTFDTPNGDYTDETITQDDDYWKAEASIVGIYF
jgi:hypothetical protein